jgi:hypothetical protein
MDHTEGARAEGRAAPRPAEKDEPLLVQDALLPWEMAGPCDALPPPPAAAEVPNPDPPASLPWEPIGPEEEPPLPLTRHYDEELPDWLTTQGPEAVPDGSNETLLPMAELEALAAAEFGPSSDGAVNVDDSTQRTVWGPARGERRTETFDPDATLIRIRKPPPRAGISGTEPGA